jgi:hypothetical protein
MADAKLPAVVNPDADLAGHLNYLMADTATLEDSPDGYRIKIFHSRGFPWEDVFKALLYRGFAVRITNHKADLFIEAAKP